MFAESPWPGLALGLIVAFCFAIGFLQTGRRVLLVWALAFVLVGLALAYLESVIKTDRERITSTIHRLAKALVENQNQEILDAIHPKASELKSRAKTEMSLYTFTRASVKNNLRVEPSSAQSPSHYLARFNVVVEIKEFPRPIPRYVELRFEKDSNGVWRVDDYSHHAPQQGYMKPLKK